MSFSIYSTEEVRICNIGKETRAAARALEQYLRQFDRRDSIQLGSVRLALTADGETVNAQTVSVPRDTDTPLWKNAPELRAAIKKLESAADVEMKLTYDIMQTCETLYGAAYWEQAFREGPVEGVTCRLLFRNVDDGPEYYCLGLSGDTVGLVPFDASEKDVVRVGKWRTDELLVSMEIAAPDAEIGVEELTPSARAFAGKYGVAIDYLEADSFLIADGAEIPAELLPSLLADLQRLRDHAAERGLTHTVESYLYADGGAFALAHIFEDADGKIRVEYCKM
ncbi:MAG: hypothetical protein IJK23_07675 [Clostridia bacterium]|nr:hypothetical protein [Clostridia bacterium]